MRACCLLLALFVFSAAAQQRKHFTINTGTPEGAILQSIGQESDEPKKLALMHDFISKYPKDEGGVGTSVKAMILARAGRAREAEGAIKHAIEIGKDYGHFHHTAYNIASAYALMNEPEPAIKWLQYAADDGFPCYPLFDNDANLTSLRKDERFVAFMAKLKQQWEGYTATL